MKNIVKYNEFCLESKNNEFDLQKEFDYLNNLMFDNKIKPVKLKWFKSKSKVGLLTHTGNQVDKLEISNFYNLTNKQFMETLAHEMIHAFMVQNSIFEKDAHGVKFHRILNDLNNRFPQYNIKKSEDASDFTVNSTKLKSIGVLLFKQDSTYDAVFVSLDIVNNIEIIYSFITDLLSYIQRTPLNIFYKFKSVELQVYKCTHPDLTSFKIKRNLSLSNLGFYIVNEKTLNNIHEGDLLETIKIK